MMPPRLELSHSNHGKVMVAPPRINLRRAISYNAQDRGPLSSTSSRFNFNHLLFSPPPSPSLPALIPRPKRRSSFNARPSRVFRIAIYCFTCITSLWFLALALRNRDVTAIVPPAVWPYFANQEFEMVGQDVLPDFPTPIVVHDKRGRSKWTVSIPRKYAFPLSTQEYADMSGQCREVSARARDLHHKEPLSKKTQLSYDAPDDYFVDVYKAEKAGMLHSNHAWTPATEAGHFVGMDRKSMIGMPVCGKSMTFVLESQDAGMGNAMMMLWTFYGLAKAEGRAFFIEDSRWAYGVYTDIFQAPPVPTCRPPPRHQMLPCPFQAQHLVVSGMTAKEVFPALLAKHHRALGTDNEIRDVWGLARAGYQALFLLNPEDKEYVESRIHDLKSKAQNKDLSLADTPIIGLHVRRGDRHPLEYQYRNTYIPAEVFHENANQAANARLGQTGVPGAKNRAIIIIASDDPTVKEEPDFWSAMPAQERIRLASKEVIEQANQQKKGLSHFVEEAFGWEGGFFAAMLWNLGVERKNNAANGPGMNNEAGRLMAAVSEQTLKLRSYVGRAYMMDLAVLAGASDSVVCAVSAMGCRLLGVMMDWESGIQGGGWINVDGGYSWTGINW